MKKLRDTRYSSFNRAMIIALVNEDGPQTISSLAISLNISRPAVYGHLEILEGKGLITRSKNLSKRGAPVSIYLTRKASPFEIKYIQRAMVSWNRICGI